MGRYDRAIALLRGNANDLRAKADWPDRREQYGPQLRQEAADLQAGADALRAWEIVEKLVRRHD